MVRQFDIGDHYDAMEQLDRDVHDDHELSATEVDTALALVGRVPRSIFLPCFGTGRHIARLLERGVQRIVGVDLSPKCVEKARRDFGHDPRVELVVGDLRAWRTPEQFEAGILLGNSFGDIVDQTVLGQVTEGMVAPLERRGAFVMDYIGQGYLDRARARVASTWDAAINGILVNDRRTPRYDEETGIMSIDVQATAKDDGRVVWTGCYQKIILDDSRLVDHFTRRGVDMTARGRAVDLNRDYYAKHGGELGMIARSTWWTGQKI